MNPTIKDLGLEWLNTDQRVALAMEIWDSLDDARPICLTAEQRAALARRDSELEADPAIALTWEQIRTSVEAKS
jgi:putative addiction module component (TIGR02574 family)